MSDRLRRPLAAPGVVAIALALSFLAACRREPDRAAPEVTLYATVGTLPVQILTTAAAQRGIARVRAVERAGDADLLWVGDPAELLALPGTVAPAAAPETAGVDAKFQDPARRFAPLCARARVLLVNPRAALPFEPGNLRDLADSRLAGRVALPPLGQAAHTTAFAVLASVYGDASVARFLDLLDRNRPIRVASDAEVAATVGRGEAAIGLAGSEAGAAGAASAAGLDVIYPDQTGRGAVVVPTAVALTARGAGTSTARVVAEYLVGPDSERVLVARVPGFMPLRADVPVPPGVRPAGNLVTLPLAWDRVTTGRPTWAARLAR